MLYAFSVTAFPGLFQTIYIKPRLELIMKNLKVTGGKRN